MQMQKQVPIWFDFIWFDFKFKYLNKKNELFSDHHDISNYLMSLLRTYLLHSTMISNYDLLDAWPFEKYSILAKGTFYSFYQDAKKYVGSFFIIGWLVFISYRRAHFSLIKATFRKLQSRLILWCFLKFKLTTRHLKNVQLETCFPLGKRTFFFDSENFWHFKWVAIG